MRREDVFLVQEAIGRGWLTQDAVKIVTQRQGARGNTTVGRKIGKSLGIALVANGFLTDVQLQELQVALRNRGLKPIFDEELIGQILLGDMAITREQLDEAFRAQMEQHGAGRRKRIGEILVERKFLEPAAVIAALRKQRKEILQCAGCGARFNVLERRADDPVPCPICASVLRGGATALDVDESTIGIRPAQPGDLPERIAGYPGPKVHFGKFVVMRELLRSSEGPLHLGWQKDSQRFVALTFGEKEFPAGYPGKVFGKLKAEAAAKKVTLVGYIESGVYGGKAFVSWSILGFDVTPASEAPPSSVAAPPAGPA